MRLLATFVMRGRAQATMVAVFFALISLQFPLFSLLSSAAIALVTLRQGVAEGGLVTGFALAVCALAGLLLLGSPMLGVGFGLILWLPVLALGWVLRTTRRLDLVVQLGLLFGLGLIALVYLETTDPVAAWREQLASFAEQLVVSDLLDAGQTEALVGILAAWMTGLLAAAFYLQLVAALLLARWWQALLYNPGGFRGEFHQLRLHRGLAVVALPLLAVLLISGMEAPALARYAGLLLLAAYLVQGLAAVHGSLALLGGQTFWVVGLYVLLVIALPQMASLIATLGYADSWVDFRRRLAARRSGG